jgi:hypothetical protein
MADPVAISRAKAQQKWRAEMDQLGSDVVRTRFTARLPVTDSMPYPDSTFVQEWLARQDRRAKTRTAFLTAIAIIGTIAACIAAWPVVKDWISH